MLRRCFSSRVCLAPLHSELDRMAWSKIPKAVVPLLRGRFGMPLQEPFRSQLKSITLCVADQDVGPRSFLLNVMPRLRFHQPNANVSVTHGSQSTLEVVMQDQSKTLQFSWTVQGRSEEEIANGLEHLLLQEITTLANVQVKAVQNTIVELVE